VRDNSDPIEGCKAYLTEMGVGEDALKLIEKEIRTIVNEAADFAETSPEPNLSELYTDVLVEQY
jgi:pyruvate dehydrogenase E1 component alpha subunit